MIIKLSRKEISRSISYLLGDFGIICWYFAHISIRRGLLEGVSNIGGEEIIRIEWIWDCRYIACIELITGDCIEEIVLGEESLFSLIEIDGRKF